MIHSPPNNMPWYHVFPYSWPLITQMAWQSICSVHCTYGGIVRNPMALRDWHYVKTENLHKYMVEVNPREPIVLLTGSSDYPVTDKLVSGLMADWDVRAWFCQNRETEDSRVHSLPIGIQNYQVGGKYPEMTHTVRSTMDEHHGKTKTMHAAWKRNTNSTERGSAERAIGGCDEFLPVAEYLASMASSKFAICPEGHGVDTVRTWEALYLRTVPVATPSPFFDEHRDLPVLVIDSWDTFDPATLTDDLYRKITRGFDWQSLYMYNWIKRMDAVIEAQ